MANEYGLLDSNGNLICGISKAKEIVSKNGGLDAVDNAVKKANNPLVKTFLSKIGIDMSVINKAVNEIKNISNTEVKSSDDLLERLKKLK